MHDDRQRPKEIGQNQLGFFLMWLRYELRLFLNFVLTFHYLTFIINKNLYLTHQLVL